MAQAIREALQSHAVPLEPHTLTLIHGAAPGADSLAEEAVAQALGHREFAVERYLADWKQHGRAAGPRRNALMRQRGAPSYWLAFPLVTHPNAGTHDMVRRLEGVPGRVVPQL